MGLKLSSVQAITLSNSDNKLYTDGGCIKSLGLSGADSGFSGSASFGVLLAVCGSVSGSGGLLLGCLGLVFGFYVVDFADVVSHCDPSELEAGFV